MARTIAEIQQEILDQKAKEQQFDALQILTPNEKQTLESELTSTSKTSIWRLWVYIVATAIWMHEKIVERNALLSRPHTLSWYREQAFDYIKGAPLVWKDGFFQFDTTQIPSIEEAKIIKHCAISERLFSDVFPNDGEQNGIDANPTQNVESLIREYYYNQVGIVTMKVAKRVDDLPKPLNTEERRVFQAYMNQIKDAGTQIRVVSTTGDKIQIQFEVYVDPLVMYTEGENKGRLIKDLSRKPVEETIKAYIETLEFNGAFVPIFLIDQVQKQEGVRLPILRKIKIAPYNRDINSDFSVDVYDDTDSVKETAFFVPTSGYFNTDFSNNQSNDDSDTIVDEGIYVSYFPYNLQTDPSFNL
ncbi:hypothetical protein D1816_04775 [Aquimarina sp. AD10]|uniref:hypothetical protein n=1 Tax=Aquimarina sp. AD10 TaxID=1714849 RepID=UPI000E4FBCAF|nr:hypothetical protein [Aquimarina sp. AD10]AXT59698.1 hypothetical protein D1816_04775 [Aquimarina sp. AD10]RKM97574.1 hypothetical protein D7033_14355 [Aquimarina sp. AD10]